MSDRTPHPDFLGAPEELRWSGSLTKLGELLRHEAYQAQGAWAQRILPGGALVLMRVPPTFRKELRVARRLRKAPTDAGEKAWHKELEVFLDQLGCKDWGVIRDAWATGTTPGLMVEMVYQEPAPLGGKAADVGTCARCGKAFELHPTDTVYRELICQPCAIALGQEEAASRG